MFLFRLTSVFGMVADSFRYGNLKNQGQRYRCPCNNVGIDQFSRAVTSQVS